MKAVKIWFKEDKIFILTDSGHELWQSLLWYPRLLEASEQQRLSYTISPFGVHWKDIDEDVSFESFTYIEREPENAVAKVLKSFPEINISQLAKRMHMPQSLLASYVSGIKSPSDKRKKEIEDTLHKLGSDLLNVSF